MLGNLPPWLSVSPHDFLLATQAGAQLGNTIAEQTQKAWEEQQRLRMEAQTQQNVAEQHAVENAMTRLAADRLEQYRQSEAANAKSRLGIEQQGLGLRGKELDVQNKRADEQERRNTTLEGIRKDAENRLEEDAKRKELAPVFHGGRWWKNDPEQGPIPLTPEPTKRIPQDPLQKSLMDVDAATLRSTEHAIAARDLAKPTGLGALLHPGYQSDTDKLKATADAMRKDMQSKYGAAGAKKRFTYDPSTSQITPIGGDGTIIDPNDEGPE